MDDPGNSANIAHGVKFDEVSKVIASGILCTEKALPIPAIKKGSVQDWLITNRLSNTKSKVKIIKPIKGRRRSIDITPISTVNLISSEFSAKTVKTRSNSANEGNSSVQSPRQRNISAKDVNQISQKR